MMNQAVSVGTMPRLATFFAMFTVIYQCLMPNSNGSDVLQNAISEINERDLLLQSFTVKTKFHGGASLAGGEIPEETVLATISRRQSDFRLIVRYPDRDPSSDVTLAEAILRDGVVTLVKGNDVGAANAVIAADPAFLPWPLPIGIALGAVDDQPLGAWLSQTEVNVSSLSGGILEVTGPDHDVGSGDQIRIAVGLDKDNHFAPIYQRKYFRNSGEDTWILSEEIVRQFVTSSAIDSALVREVAYTLYLVEDTGDSFPVKQERVKFQDWRFPSVVPESEFALTIPDGTVVNDQLNDRTYISRRINDRDVELALSQVNSERTSLNVIVLAAATIAVVFGASTFWLMSRRTRRD